MDTTFKQGVTKSVAYTGTAGTIAAVGAKTTKVRVWCSTDAFVKIGDAPTATTSDMPMAAGIPEYFDITPGQKVSYIQSATGGTGYATEMSKT